VSSGSQGYIGTGAPERRLDMSFVHRLGFRPTFLVLTVATIVGMMLASDTNAGPRLIWHDEFSGSGAPQTTWTHEVGGSGWGNDELETYTSRPTNSYLDGQGHLVVVARRERYAGRDGIVRDYTSAKLVTKGRFSFEHGRVAARIQIPSGPGIWPGFWLVGADLDRVGWPAAGEIDVMEVNGRKPEKVNGTVHGPGPQGSAQFGGSATLPQSLASGFHVYGANWTRSEIQFTLDGETYATVERANLPAATPWAFDQRMFLILNVAVGGTLPGPPTLQTTFPARMLVDWIRIWR
jgi:beta-glucanase (GH16 family)